MVIEVNNNNRKKILLVEDSQLTVQFITDFLYENGYETKVTARGEEAVYQIAKGLSVDLILMDIGLEGEMNGIEAARRIIEFRDIPVVFITANTSKEIIEQIKEVRAYGFVLKGTEKAVMLSTIEMALKLHEANAQVKIKKATLSAIMDATKDSIILFDEKRKVTYCNLAAQRFFGYSRDEILGKELDKLVLSYKWASEPDGESFGLNDKRAYMGRNIELIVQHKNGNQINVEISLSTLKLKGLWYGVGVLRNISSRKLQEEKIEKSRREYLELAENSPVGVLKCNLEGKITYINEKVLEIMGSPSFEETKKINLFTFPFMVEGGLSEKLQQCLTNKQSSTEEVHYRTKWGKNVWLRAHIKLLYDENDVTGMQIIIDEITQEKQLEEKLRLLSVTDELTGTYNRRHMKEILDGEIKKSLSSGNRFSIIMFDIDHFKLVNDSYGHNVGDLILETIAQEMKSGIRKRDVLARWGGEEFIILLPDTVIEKAAELAEQLRQRLSHKCMPWAGCITASFGVACYSLEDSIDTLVKRADMMMYKAKNDGRNCVRYMDNCM